MTTKSKSKSKSTAKKPPAAKSRENVAFDAALASFRAAMPSASDRRKELLAQVAGYVASGIVISPSPTIASSSGVATAAVDIAEEILKKAGIASTKTSAGAVSVTNNEERYGRILDFLMTEWARTENRQLVGVDLFYVPGQGYGDELLRSWERADEPQFFTELANVEKLVATIIASAERETDAKNPGKHRFSIRTRQYLGSKATFSFPCYAGSAEAAS